MPKSIYEQYGVIAFADGQTDDRKRVTFGFCDLVARMPSFGSISDSGETRFLQLCGMLLKAFVIVALLHIIYAEDKSQCGTIESDFAPCVPKDRANALFKQCCQQYAPEGCQELCQYESDEITARNLLMQSIKSEKCDLKHMGAVLFCASQNQDNRKCCEHLNMADAKLGVGNRCLRFCDPAGEGINTISRNDVTCLFNWNVLMYCHHSGIPEE